MLTFIVQNSKIRKHCEDSDRIIILLRDPSMVLSGEKTLLQLPIKKAAIIIDYGSFINVIYFQILSNYLIINFSIRFSFEVLFNSNI